MSRAAVADESTPRKALRTATPPNRGRPDREMDAIGWLVFVGTAIILVSLFPFVVALWAIVRTLEAVSGPNR